MEETLTAYGFPKETVRAIVILYKITKAMVHSSDKDTDFFDIGRWSLAKKLAPSMVNKLRRLRTSSFDRYNKRIIDLIKEEVFALKKAKCRRYLVETMTTQITHDLVVLVNTLIKSKTDWKTWNQKQEALVNRITNKTEYISFKLEGAIST